LQAEASVCGLGACKCAICVLGFHCI